MNQDIISLPVYPQACKKQNKSCEEPDIGKPAQIIVAEIGKIIPQQKGIGEVEKYAG